MPFIVSVLDLLCKTAFTLFIQLLNEDDLGLNTANVILVIVH